MCTGWINSQSRSLDPEAPGEFISPPLAAFIADARRCWCCSSGPVTDMGDICDATLMAIVATGDRRATLLRWTERDGEECRHSAPSWDQVETIRESGSRPEAEPCDPDKIAGSVLAGRT